MELRVTQVILAQAEQSGAPRGAVWHVGVWGRRSDKHDKQL